MMRRAGGFVVLSLLAVGCSGVEPPAERSEPVRGRGTFLVLGEPVEADYQMVAGDWTIFGDIGIDPETELISLTSSPGEVSLAAFKTGGSLKSHLWPNAVIPYKIHSNVTTPGRVHDAMAEWEKKTKIEFVKKTNQSSFLHIYEDGNTDACKAQVGHASGERYMKLRPNGGCNLGVITHELGHTIGFVHEHQRPERNQYVKIKLSCVDSKHYGAFDIFTSGHHAIGPYDINSTMHYRSTSLSYNCAYPNSSILKKNGTTIMHEWATLSVGDVNAVAKMYGPKEDDQDSDGVLDSNDNCKSVANDGQLDTDKDDKGDACDADDDGDGIDDGPDNCPKKANGSQLDTDTDGAGDACDGDDDGDGIADADDNCTKATNPSQLDTDKDDQGNACDEDDDGDGIPDTTDNCPTVSNSGQVDSDQDGKGDACVNDNDDDGIPDADDNCPKASNADQADGDDDGLGDSCDPDADGDGVDDTSDNCPKLSNADQKDENQDQIGDACQDDGDEDGIPDAVDNCPTIPNPDQYDSDGEGAGDACLDSDTDGTPDELDNCPDAANADQADEDQDGLGDACDTDPNTAPDLPGAPGLEPPGQKTTVLAGSGGCQLGRLGKGSQSPLSFALALALAVALTRRSNHRGGSLGTAFWESIWRFRQ